MSEQLAHSTQYCKQLTRSAARNFYYGLRLLPEPKRSAMFALYAYMRLVDDIADREDGRTIAQRTLELESWRSLTHAALNGQNLDGETGALRINPADLGAGPVTVQVIAVIDSAGAEQRVASDPIPLQR